MRFALFHLESFERIFVIRIACDLSIRISSILLIICRSPYSFSLPSDTNPNESNVVQTSIRICIAFLYQWHD